MWIFCCGGKRTGSTLQYNLLAEIVEHSNIGKRVEFVPPNGFPELKNKYKDYKGLKVFKTHKLTPQIKQEFDQNNAIGFYTYRDIRDVLVSFSNKYSKPINSFIAEDGFIENYVNDYFEWMNVRNIHQSKYEDFIGEIGKEVQRYASILSLELDADFIETLKKKYSLQEQKEFIKSIEKAQTENLNTFDKTTLLHVNHINSGEINQWKSKMTPEDIRLTEEKCFEWLVNNGYHLENKSLIDRVKLYSNSQHFEDSFVWHYLKKKTNGLVVEVGAFDGIHLSNSYSLEKIGWKAICIEPNEIYFKKLILNRPKSVSYHLAAVESDDIKSIEFMTEELGLLSGVKINESEVKERYKKRGLDYKEPQKISVQARTLNSIFKENNILKGEIDFVSIDVEGSEIEVLKGFDLVFFEPAIIQVEANNEKQKMELVEYMAIFKDYELKKEIGVNLFFIHSKKLNSINNDWRENVKQMPQFHPLGDKYNLNRSNQKQENKFSFFKKLFGK